MVTAQPKIDKKTLNRWFDKERGRKKRCSEALGISHTTLVTWLQGKTVSARLDRDVPEFVRANTTGR